MSRHAGKGAEIEEAQLRGFARRVAEVEWLLLALVLLYLFVANPGLVRHAAVLVLLVAFAAVIAVFRYAPRQLQQWPRIKINAELLVMLAFLTGVLTFDEGAQSPLFNLYLLPIVTAALALGRRGTAMVVGVVILCYLMLAILAAGPLELSAGFGIAAVTILAPFVLVAFSTTLLAENVHHAKQQIRTLSDRDELTSVYNMTAFVRLAEREHEAASKADKEYSILLIDIEHLKQINDTQGQEAGNRALRLVAEALQRLTRSTDLVGRFGGDEFIVYLANTDKAVAKEVAQRIRNVVFATTLDIELRMLRIKVDVGVATFPENGTTLQYVMTIAERMMHKDKELRDSSKGKVIIEKLLSRSS